MTHMKRVHDRELKYECEICHQKFFTSWHLKVQHMPKHEREWKLKVNKGLQKCDYCDLSFKISSSMRFVRFDNVNASLTS